MIDTAVMIPWVRTFSGKRINPLDVRPDDISVLDMGHQLANINRFVGATRRPVDVALHSVFVSRVAERLAPPSRKAVAALQGLVHDGSEYILGEVTKWLKRTPEMAGYVQAEERAQAVIYGVVGAPVVMLAEVKQADDLMVRIEAEDSWGAHWSHVPGYHPLTNEERGIVGPWKTERWDISRRLFYARYTELTGTTVEIPAWLQAR